MFLTACGSSTPDPSGEPPPAARLACADAGLAGERTSISLQWSGPWDEVAAAAFLDRFRSAGSGVDVAPSASAGEVVSMMSGSAPPTLATVPVEAVGTLADAGLIRPLDGCLDDALRPALDAVRPLGVVDQVRYGITGNVDAVFMLYDAQLFSEAGLDPDRPPRTWPELHAAATALRAHTAVTTPVAGLSPLVAVFGDQPSGELPLNARTWLQMSNDGLFLDGADLGAFPPLGDRHAAIQIVSVGELWDYASSLAQGQAPAADLRVAAVPGTTQSIVPIGGRVWVMSSAASDAQAATATALLEWLLQDPQQAMLHQLTDLFPVARTVASDATATSYWAGLPLMADAWRVFAAHATPPPEWMLQPRATLAAHHLLADADTVEAATAAWSSLHHALDQPHDPEALLACAFPPNGPPALLTACTGR